VTNRLIAENEGLDADLGTVTHPLPPGVIVERDVRVKVRDGVLLDVTVARPEGEGRYPVIMCVTAYGKDFGPDQYSTLPKIKASGNAVRVMHICDVTTWEGPDPSFWVPNGYVVIVADPRGFYGSEGQAGIFSEKDAEDYNDLIEWAGTQPWSSGAVGLNGVSYLAISQWMAAAKAQSPYLKAIASWEGVSDLRQDWVEHGGIPETRFLRAWYTGSLARGAGEQMAETGPQMMARAAERPFELEKITVPALICGTWSDHGLHSRSAFEGFRRISSSQKWLYTHGGNKWERYYSKDALSWQKAFFDHFLKGDDNDFEQWPRVRLETRVTQDQYEVRSENMWPIESAEYLPAFLDIAERGLAWFPPAEAGSQTFDAEAKEALAFDLLFDRDTEVTGAMALKLWVSVLDADDLDIFVAVRKIDQQGNIVHFYAKDGWRDGEVALGWLRISERHLDAEHYQPWRPILSRSRTQKVRLGEIVPVEIEILASSTLFEAGETLSQMYGRPTYPLLKQRVLIAA